MNKATQVLCIAAIILFLGLSLRNILKQRDTWAEQGMSLWYMAVAVVVALAIW